VLPHSLPSSATCADIIGAIFDSHRRAWADAAEAAEEHTLVLEDDVSLPASFGTWLALGFAELPSDYHLAFVGVSATPRARTHSAHLLRPDEDDPNGQAVLGMWGYLVSRAGARRLLELSARAAGGKRSFQPVDLFVSHRLRQLRVFVFSPPDELARAFAAKPDRQHSAAEPA